MSQDARAMDLVLCEGYHDRAFWKGALLRLGAEDLRPRLGRAVDNWNEVSTKYGRGTHGYWLPVSGRQLRVQPCGGNDEVLEMARTFVARHATKPLGTLVVVLECDVYEGSRERTLQAVRTKLPADAGTSVEDSAWRSSGVDVRAVALSLDQAATPGVPAQQCLERIVCAALAESFPVRATHVDMWLRSRPQAPTDGDAKSHAWSYMAGWHAKEGIEYFLESLWLNDRVAVGFARALQSTGALEALGELVGVDVHRAFLDRT